MHPRSHYEVRNLTFIIYVIIYIKYITNVALSMLKCYKIGYHLHGQIQSLKEK